MECALFRVKDPLGCDDNHEHSGKNRRTQGVEKAFREVKGNSFLAQYSFKEVVVELQLALPLEADSRNETALRLAWARSRLPVPYHVALQDRVYAICLRCFAAAMQRKTS